MRAKELIRILTESPELVPSDNFGLRDPIKNAKLLASMMSDKRTTKVGTVKGDELFQIDHDLFLVRNHLGQKHIVYLVEFDIENLKLLGRESVVQLKVWRDTSIPGTGAKMFWDYIFPLTGLAVSDTMQTEEGKEFWYNQVRNALLKGLFCYLLDFNKGTKIKITHIGDFRAVESQAYGKGRDFQSMRFCISDKAFLDAVPI